MFFLQIPRSIFHVSIMRFSTKLHCFESVWNLIILIIIFMNAFSHSNSFTCRFPKEKKDVLLLAKSQIADGITVQGVWKSVFPVHKNQSIRDNSTGSQSYQNRNLFNFYIKGFLAIVCTVMLNKSKGSPQNYSTGTCSYHEQWTERKDGK
jgi:hypothetical protein